MLLCKQNDIVLWMLLSAVTFMFNIAYAEPPVHLSPAEIAKGLLYAVTAPLTTPKPMKIFNACSKETDLCRASYMESHAFSDSDSREQRLAILAKVTDDCWKQSKQCPESCKQRYLAVRKTGMGALQADTQVLFNDRPSCIPGYDELLHPKGSSSTQDQ